MSRAILPKLTAKWKTKSNMGPHNKGVSEQIRQTKWINKQQKPDLEIMAEMLIRTVIEAAAVAGGARPWRRKADATADGGGGLPAEDSTAAGNVGLPLPRRPPAAADSPLQNQKLLDQQHLEKLARFRLQQQRPRWQDLLPTLSLKDAADLSLTQRAQRLATATAAGRRRYRGGGQTSASNTDSTAAGS